MTDYPLQQTPEVPNSLFTAVRYTIERILSKVSTASLVQVTKVTNKGEVKEVGQVNVKPLVNMMDGIGTNYKHGEINNLIYFRLQGGSKAVILDPKVGDIGVAVFADRDISNVKKNKKQSPPGSYRRFDAADGMFFPCFLGEKPTCYVQFTDDDHIKISPDDGKTYVEVQKDWVHLQVTGQSVHLRPGRVDLGKLDAPHAVMTVDGPSLRVFAVIDESD